MAPFSFALPPALAHVAPWVLALGAVVAAALLALLALRRRRRPVGPAQQPAAPPTRTAPPDPLGGLMPMAQFERALDEATLACDLDGSSLALLYIGLDNLQAIDDAHGRQTGHHVRARACELLRTAVGAPLALTRPGEEEFALLLHAGADEAADAAEHLVRVLQQDCRVGALPVRVEASVGVALYPDHGARTRVLAHAALAMRSVRQLGGCGHASYDPALAVDRRDRAALLHDLRQALERGQLRLVYQPKVDARSLQITAAEALLRWEHPHRGTLAPALFIPLAERHGLIDAIGRWVIDESCHQARLWHDFGLDTRLRVAVNLSAAQMRQDGLVEHITDALQRHGLPPDRLGCEIAETVASGDDERTRSTLARLHALGVHLSIDDFGGGAAGFDAIGRLPVAELKIDRSLVPELARSERARARVRTIAERARAAGLRVVGEGVETAAQRDALVALGCDELQGYLFARPMSAASLALWADPGADAAAAAQVQRRAPAAERATAAAPLTAPVQRS